MLLFITRVHNQRMQLTPQIHRLYINLEFCCTNKSFSRFCSIINSTRCCKRKAEVLKIGRILMAKNLCKVAERRTVSDEKENSIFHPACYPDNHSANLLQLPKPPYSETLPIPSKLEKKNGYSIGECEIVIPKSLNSTGNSSELEDPGGTFPPQNSEPKSEFQEDFSIEPAQVPISFDPPTKIIRQDDSDSESSTSDSSLSTAHDGKSGARESKSCPCSEVDQSNDNGEVTFKDALIARLDAELKCDDKCLKLLKKRRPKRSHTGTQTPDNVSLHNRSLSSDDIEASFMSDVSVEGDLVQKQKRKPVNDKPYTPQEKGVQADQIFPNEDTQSLVSEDTISPSVFTSQHSPNPIPLTSTPSKTPRRKKKQKSSKLKWQMLSPVGNEYIYVTKQVYSVTNHTFGLTA